MIWSLSPLLKKLGDQLTVARAANIDNLDATIASRLADNDARLDNLDATIASRLADNDARLDNLDATIASRLASGDSRLSNVDTPLSGRVASADSRLDHLDADLSSVTTGLKSLQTAYIDNPSRTGGSGEDVGYVDITISSVVMAKTLVWVHFTGNQTYGLTGRLIDSTTLRVSRIVNAAMYGRYYVVEFH